MMCTPNALARGAEAHAASALASFEPLLLITTTHITRSAALLVRKSRSDAMLSGALGLLIGVKNQVEFSNHEASGGLGTNLEEVIMFPERGVGIRRPYFNWRLRVSSQHF